MVQYLLLCDLAFGHEILFVSYVYKKCKGKNPANSFIHPSTDIQSGILNEIPQDNPTAKFPSCSMISLPRIFYLIYPLLFENNPFLILFIFFLLYPLFSKTKKTTKCVKSMLNFLCFREKNIKIDLSFCKFMLKIVRALYLAL
jgi:hypothetical protein